MNGDHSRSQTDLLTRVVNPRKAAWPREWAEAVLEMGFSDEDQDRAADLASKAGEGTLSSEEAREMQEFMMVGRMLDLMQARARLSLKQNRAA